MAKRTLYLLRHGQEERSYRKLHPEDDDQGPLTEIGRKQSAEAATYLANFPLTHIYTSTKLRTLQTAKPILATHPAATCENIDLIREVVPSVPPRHADHFSYMTPELTQHFTERISDTFARFFRTASQTEEHVLLVTHGNLIRALIGKHIGAGQEAWTTMQLHNASLTTFVFEPGEFDILLRFNEVGYLSAELQTLI